MKDILDKEKSVKKNETDQTGLIHSDRLSTLGTMAAGIAHELKQPLNTIKIIADGILFSQEKGWSLNIEEFTDDLRMISDQASNMSSILSSIRDFARSDVGADLVEVEINQAIENVLFMLERQMDSHNIHIISDLDWDVGSIQTMHTRLEQILINLLANAREALEECRRKNKKIWITTKKTDAHIVIELADNATGIPESLGKSIFEPYFTTKDVGKGTGLGLSISHTIINEMGGTIKFYNNKKGGTTFIIILPETRRGK